MRFLDANVFIYAYYKPKRKLTERQKEMKERSKEIIRKINEGEDVITTVVHLSEVTNIIKRKNKTFLSLVKLSYKPLQGLRGRGAEPHIRKGL